MINYLYLIVIILIILSIIYIIHISYEYRGNILKNIEPFISPSINILTNNNNLNNSIGSFLNNYNNLYNNVYNQQIIKDNNEYQKLNKQSETSLSNTNTLIKNKQELKIIPDTFPLDKLIKTIKSKYNSQLLSLFANEYLTTNNTNKYGILVNDKCLTVSKLCNGEYCLQNCQNNLHTSDSQKFYTNRIYSELDASKITPSLPISQKNIYPYNIFRSSITDKCLTMSNDGITLENCNPNNIKQQWQISPDENICKLN